MSAHTLIAAFAFTPASYDSLVGRWLALLGESTLGDLAAAVAEAGGGR